MNNNIYKSKRININSNYNKPYYSTKNSYIIRSPTLNTNKKMNFINNKNVGCRKILFDYDGMKGGKIEKYFDKKNSNDEKYIIETTSPKKVYDKINQEIEIIENEENDEENELQFRVRRNFGDNYKYFERNISPLKNCNNKTFHNRRSPAHVFGYEHYFILENSNNRLIVSPWPIIGRKRRINSEENVRKYF
jgi:hypothetical protein